MFPNQGVLMKPYQILKVLDREGNLLEENRPQLREAIRADTAYVMTSLLRGVVQRGTGAAAAALEWPLGGKTGHDRRLHRRLVHGIRPRPDGWRVGGPRRRRPLGTPETGAMAALPIWMDVMKAYIEKRGDRQNPPVFDAPGNIVFVSVDRVTGQPLSADAPGRAERGVHRRHPAGRHQVVAAGAGRWRRLNVPARAGQPKPSATASE